MDMLKSYSLFDYYDGFDHYFPNYLLANKGESNTPRVDVTEEQNCYLIKADLPGVKKENVNVSFDNGSLIIETEFNQQSQEENEGKILHQERRYGKYMRNLYLGDNVDKDNIDATFTDGVLTLTVTKKEPVVDKAQQIEIH